MKKLEHIEDQNGELLKLKNRQENIKEVTDFVRDPLSLEAKALVEEIKIVQKDVDYRKLIIRGGNNVMYDFSDFKTFNELFRDLYYKKMTMNDAEVRQNKFNSKHDALDNYSPKNKKYIEAKNSLINNAKTFTRGEKGFKEKIFLIKFDDETEQQQSSKKPTKNDVMALNEWIIEEKTSINRKLFKKYFLVQILSALLKDLYKTNDKEKNNKLVSMISSGLKDLRKEIKEMSEEEREIEKPYKIVEIVKEILKFNKQVQQGKGLKILTPQQMLSRFPISLAQLNAGNNSEKLKNEIRQLLYSLYISKNMTKEVYNNLIKYI